MSTLPYLASRKSCRAVGVEVRLEKAGRGRERRRVRSRSEMVFVDEERLEGLEVLEEERRSTRFCSERANSSAA